MITSPIYPGYVDPDGSVVPYRYLASIGLSSGQLMSACVKEVIVTAVSSIEDNTVEVEFDGITYTDVPVWIHTDYGCRARKLNSIEARADEDLPISASNPVLPELYFERASLMFTFKEDVWHRPAKHSFDPSYEWNCQARPIKAVALIGDGEIYGIINIIDNGVITLSYVPDRRTYALPTFRPYLLLKELVGAVESFSLFDLLTGATALIPNPDYSALILAEGLISSSDYDEFFAGGIEETPQTNYSIEYCQVIEPAGETPSAVGDTTNVGSCTCDGTFGNTWQCSAFYEKPDPFGYKEYTWVDLCGTGSSVYVKTNEGDVVSIPTAATWYWNFVNWGGQNTISWNNRTRIDYRDASYARTNSYTGGTDSYAFTLIINDEEVTFTDASNPPEFSEIIFESVGSLFFSFSIIQVIIDPPNTDSFGSLENDIIPATGITTDGITSFIADRYTTLQNDNPTATVEVKPTMVFIPYDIREMALEE